MKCENTCAWITSQIIGESVGFPLYFAIWVAFAIKNGFMMGLDLVFAFLAVGIFPWSTYNRIKTIGVYEPMHVNMIIPCMELKGNYQRVSPSALLFLLVLHHFKEPQGPQDESPEGTPENPLSLVSSPGSASNLQRRSLLPEKLLGFLVSPLDP
ncbi:hypothetical protein VNO77_19718 [Canavalia gladiata]|uniref:Uncharacterized protein n=1 Tax=Canavalia gladiata TaxID=3824 RepID=A0AAN9LN16_CANGL